MFPAAVLLLCVLAAPRVLTAVSISVKGPSTNYTSIGCPGQGPFSTISHCFIRCDNSDCKNAFDSCVRLPDACTTILRSEHGMNIELTGQLVELVYQGDSLSQDQNEKVRGFSLALPPFHVVQLSPNSLFRRLAITTVEISTAQL